MRPRHVNLPTLMTVSFLYHLRLFSTHSGDRIQVFGFGWQALGLTQYLTSIAMHNPRLYLSLTHVVLSLAAITDLCYDFFLIILACSTQYDRAKI